MSHRRKIGRDAVSGQFISLREAYSRPANSVIETVVYPSRIRERRRRSVRSLTQEPEPESGFKAGKDL